MNLIITPSTILFVGYSEAEAVYMECKLSATQAEHLYGILPISHGSEHQPALSTVTSVGQTALHLVTGQLMSIKGEVEDRTDGYSLPTHGRPTDGYSLPTHGRPTDGYSLPTHGRPPLSLTSENLKDENTATDYSEPLFPTDKTSMHAPNLGASSATTPNLGTSSSVHSTVTAETLSASVPVGQSCDTEAKEGLDLPDLYTSGPCITPEGQPEGQSIAMATLQGKVTDYCDDVAVFKNRAVGISSTSCSSSVQGTSLNGGVSGTSCAGSVPGTTIRLALAQIKTEPEATVISPDCNVDAVATQETNNARPPSDERQRLHMMGEDENGNTNNPFSVSHLGITMTGTRESQ